MNARLFVYGTLLDDERVRGVTPRSRAVVPEGQDARALRGLDAYEDAGVLYVREERIVTCDGAPVRCFVYRARHPPG